MDTSSLISWLWSVLKEVLPNSPADVRLAMLLPVVAVVLWFVYALLGPDKRARILKLLRNPWFYLSVVVLFAASLAYIQLTKPVQFRVLGVDASTRPRRPSIVLQTWPQTSANVNNTQMIRDSRGNRVSLYYSRGDYGFGLQYSLPAAANLSRYRHGYVCFSLRGDSNTLDRLRVGIQSADKDSAWQSIDFHSLSMQEGGPHDFSIAISQFKTENPAVDLSRTTQFFMLEALANQKGRLDLYNVFWKSK